MKTRKRSARQTLVCPENYKLPMYNVARSKQILIGTQQNLIQPNDNLRAILEFVCGEASKLTNCGIYYARQRFFKTHKYVGKFDLNNQIKSNKHFQAMHSQAAQQTLQSVAESFKSYKALAKDYRAGSLANKQKLPNYRKPGLAVVSYPKQALKLVDGVVRVPLGTLVNTWFKLKYFELPLPGNFPDDCWEFIKELRISCSSFKSYCQELQNPCSATILVATDTQFKCVTAYKKRYSKK